MLEHILKDDPVYRQLKDEVEDYCGPVLVSGCTDTAKWHLTSLIGNHKKKQFKIIIVPDENKARQWVEASHFFGEKVQYIPAKDPLFYTADVHGNAIARDRMLAIKQIVDDKCGTFVMTIDAVMDQVVPLSDIKNHKMTFKMGETLEEATIAEEFVARGYEKVPFVEAPGEFAVRGGIIDIFPYTQESPYRIELWGDEIDSIRSFDKESQRSIEEVDTLTIYPASEIILNQPRIEHGLRNMEEDYEKLSQKFKKEKKYDQEARLRKEMDRVRRIIADHMVMSKKVSPHVTNVLEVDVTKLVRWREKNKDVFFRHEGVKLTYMPMITEAVAKALVTYPQLNVSVDGYNILFKKHINVGIAVSLNDGNLIVPVVHDADHLNLNGLAVAIDSLALKARDNKLMPEDIDGGTFTITNFGTFKSLFGTPIINQPQVAILGVGYIEKKPAVVETPEGDTIAIRHKMYLSLSYDHRVVDGMLGGNFLHFIADYLENWKG